MGKSQTKTYKHELNKPKKSSSQKRDKKPVQAIRNVKAPVFSPNGIIEPVSVLFSVFIIFTLLMIRPEGWIRPTAYAIPFLLASFPIGRNALAKIRMGEFFCSEIISILAAVLLFALSLYFEAVLFLSFYYGVSCTEHFLDKRSKQELERILDILPESAQLITENGIARVLPEELQTGDIILVSAGERIPVDGIIVKGITTIDTAAISGQRSPWAVNEGYRVYSGSMNLTSDVRVRVTRRYEQTTVRNVVGIAKDAEGFPSAQAYQAHRYSVLHVPVVLILFVLVAIVIPLFRGGWAEQLRRGAVLLILACTLIRDYAIPLCYRKGLYISVKMGVFSKGLDCFESLARAETIIFDKTKLNSGESSIKFCLLLNEFNKLII